MPEICSELLQHNSKPRTISALSLSWLLIFLVCLGSSSTNALITVASELRSGESISVSETMVSPNGDFQLGFLSPGQNSVYYVGIWYKKNISDCVWVANRDYPVLTSSAILKINSDGNIVISDGRMLYMVTNTLTQKGSYAKLLNSGNLELNSSENNLIWQSFDHPTHTLLSRMKLYDNSALVSWKSEVDPAPGRFSLKLDSVKKQLIIEDKESNTNWNCNAISYNGTVNLTKGYLSIDEQASSDKISRLVLKETGDLKLESWSEADQRWRLSFECTNQENQSKKDVLFITLSIVVLVMLSFAIFFLRRMRNFAIFFLHGRRKLGSKGENLLLFDVEMSLKAHHSEAELPELRKSRKQASKLAFFSFRSVSAATENFSDVKKIGEGGYGPVYRGTLEKGEVAIKRHSRRSKQGLVQFKNEAHLIARLQHRNLVRLLGCCTEKGEKILIYEYMQNQSLDFFLFDSTRCKFLTWQTRVRIIEGIAQGLLYLHQYSRIRIIHRDLKASNILLDNEMNPKISDFGLARIFEINQTHANAERPHGTIGYMSPEYAQQGLFSEKSDVYSFGVLFLEILSGKKNTDSHNSWTRGLVAYAWELWTSDRGLDLLDPSIEDTSAMHMTLRYVHIAFLCVQENAADRPNMSQVVLMLSNMSTTLPYPKQPAFLNSKATVKLNPVPGMPEVYSVNNLTLSTIQAR